jgi:hypothetical protein
MPFQHFYEAFKNKQSLREIIIALCFYPDWCEFVWLEGGLAKKLWWDGSRF